MLSSLFYVHREKHIDKITEHIFYEVKCEVWIKSPISPLFAWGSTIVQHRSLQSGNLNDFLSNLGFAKGFDGYKNDRQSETHHYRFKK